MIQHSNADLRFDLSIITNMVAPYSRVLDIGCGDGALLSWLDKHKHVDCRGVELSMKGVHHAVSRGLSVVQGDADTDLADYPAQAFDYVILSQTLQATRAPALVLEQMLRIGTHAIVSFPNFAHWRVRLNLLYHGQMPMTKNLAYQWYDTPNIHLCTIRDFITLCRHLNVQIKKFVALNDNGQIITPYLANIRAEQALFLLKRF